MADPSLDVVGIGNAIVDVLGQADEAFLTTHDLAKGSMTLIDGNRAEELYAAMTASPIGCARRRKLGIVAPLHGPGDVVERQARHGQHRAHQDAPERGIGKPPEGHGEGGKHDPAYLARPAAPAQSVGVGGGLAGVPAV